MLTAGCGTIRYRLLRFRKHTSSVADYVQVSLRSINSPALPDRLALFAVPASAGTIQASVGWILQIHGTAQHSFGQLYLSAHVRFEIFSFVFVA
jgi:hypothetical protein